jgi:hypothetical protein
MSENIRSSYSILLPILGDYHRKTKNKFHFKLFSFIYGRKIWLKIHKNGRYSHA